MARRARRGARHSKFDCRNISCSQLFSVIACIAVLCMCWANVNLAVKETVVTSRAVKAPELKQLPRSPQSVAGLPETVEVPEFNPYSAEFRQLCNRHLKEGQWQAEKLSVVKVATIKNDISLMDALAAVNELEKVGSKAEAALTRESNLTNALVVRASLISKLRSIQRNHKHLEATILENLKARLTTLKPRKELLKYAREVGAPIDGRWISGSRGENCVDECSKHQLNCDASKLRLESDEQMKIAFNSTGLECTNADSIDYVVNFEWDGPWIDESSKVCGGIFSHEFWTASCSTKSAYRRLCPCTRGAAQEKDMQKATGIVDKKVLGKFQDINVTIPLDSGLIDKVKEGRGDEERSVVAYSALQCLDSSCVVYAFGSNYLPGYEKLMAAYGCIVHVFDCTMTSDPARLLKFLEELAPHDNIVFHPWCVSASKPQKKMKSGYGWEALDAFYTLDEIMSKLGHRQIDVVKFDIEGFEWPLFDLLLSSASLPSQLHFELHVANANHRFVPPELVWDKGRHEVDLLFQKLLLAGYQIADIKPNNVDAACSEFVLVHVG